jgi:hypothetical protein
MTHFENFCGVNTYNTIFMPHIFGAKDSVILGGIFEGKKSINASKYSKTLS